MLRIKRIRLSILGTSHSIFLLSFSVLYFWMISYIKKIDDGLLLFYVKLSIVSDTERLFAYAGFLHCNSYRPWNQPRTGVHRVHSRYHTLNLDVQFPAFHGF